MLGVPGKPDVSPARAPSSLLRWVPVVLDHRPPALNVVSDMANLPYVVLERMGKWILEYFQEKLPSMGLAEQSYASIFPCGENQGVGLQGNTKGVAVCSLRQHIYKGHSRHGDVCNEEAIPATPKVKFASGPQICVNYQIDRRTIPCCEELEDSTWKM